MRRTGGDRLAGTLGVMSGTISHGWSSRTTTGDPQRVRPPLVPTPIATLLASTEIHHLQTPARSLPSSLM